MPLRYLQLPESQYIPRHAPISEQLIDRVHQTIDAQGREALQRMDAYDEFGGNVMSSLQGLTDSQRMEAQDMLHEGRATMEGYVEEHGARGAKRHIARQAREFQGQIAPYQQRSQQIMQIQERIQESEADSFSKNFVLNNIMSANEETPIGEQIRQSEHLATLDNWVNYEEYFGNLTKYIKDPTNEGYIESQDPNVQLWARTTGRKLNDVMQVLTGQAMQNPQIMAQLRLEAEMLASQGAIDEYIDENTGKVDFDKKVAVDFTPKDEDGNPIGEQVTDNMSILERLLLSKSQAIGLARTNYGVQLDKNQFLGGKDDMVGSDRIITSVGGQSPYKNVSEMYKKTNEELKDLNDKLVGHSADIKRHAERHGITIDEIRTDDTRDSFIFKAGTNRYTEEQIAEKFAHDPGAYLAFNDLLGVKRYTNNSVRRIETERQDFEDHIIGRIRDDEFFSQFADYIDFNPASGNITFREGSAFVDVSSINLESEKSIDHAMLSLPSNREALDNLKEGELQLGVELSIPPPGSQRGMGMVSKARFNLIKKDGKIYNLDQLEQARNLRQAAESYQQAHFDATVKPKEFVMMYFSPEKDKDVLNQISEEIIDFNREAIDVNGKTLMVEDDQRILAQGMSPMNGQAYLVGHIIDRESGEPVHRNVRIQSDTAESIARNRFGSEFESMALQQEFYKFIPTPGSEGKRGKTFTRQDMQMFSFDPKYHDKEVKITTTTYSVGGSPRHTFVVTAGEESKSYSRFPDILLDLISGNI